MKMMNIALPRKKSRRGSRPLLSTMACPCAILLPLPQPVGDRQEGRVALGEIDGLAAANRQDHQTRQPHRAGFLEENAAIAIGIDAERRDEMEEDGARHDAESQRGTDQLGGRDEQQDRGDELYRAGLGAQEFVMSVES